MLKFVLVVALVAAAVYFAMRALDRRQGGGGTPQLRRPPSRPMGPDDDPDFLWSLNKKKRHPGDEPPSTS